MDFKLDIRGFSDILKLIADLLNGIKALGQITVSHRQKLIKSLCDTAELIDHTLTILKVQLSKIIKEIQASNLSEAKKLIAELDNQHDWENRYRQFQMCEPLMEVGRELETLLNRELINDLSLKNSQKAQGLIYDYIRNESAVANLISKALNNLSKLTPLVDTNPQQVIAEVENAKIEIQKWRVKFISIEKDLRKSI